MEPIDALPQDRHRYYDGGWMIHDDGNVYRVTVNEEGELYGRRVGGGESVNLMLEEMHPYYPVAQAFNHSRYGALHMTRRPRQIIRRTASVQHYEVLWSQTGVCTDRSVMDEFCKHDLNPMYPSINEVGERATAISPTTIIVPTPNAQLVFYMGSEIGRVVEGLFIPNEEDGLLPKMLRHEGILCI